MKDVCFTLPGRTGYQYASSDRDIAWLEKQGWKRVEPAKVEEVKPVPVLLKRGRPRKESPVELGSGTA